MYIIIFFAALILITVIATVKAGKRETKSYMKWQAWAVGLWLVCFIAIVAVASYYLNTHGIKFQPAPISLTSK